MKAIVALLLLPARVCFAQSPYRYVVDTPTQLGENAVPAYHSFADTTGKPFTKLFAHSTAVVVGRVGTRWAVLKKRDAEYLVRTSDLPPASQQAVVTAALLPPIAIDSATGRILYSDVVQVPGASQTELYARAKLWFADTFASAKDVVQVADKEAGVIQGTAFQPITFEVLGYHSLERLWYTVKIVLKDGRYKYDLTEFRVQEYPTQYLVVGDPIPAEGYIDLNQKKEAARSLARSARRELALAITALTSSLTTGMSKPVAGPTAGNDW